MVTKLATVVLGASLIAGAGCATESGTGAAVGAIGGGVIGGALGGSTGLVLGAAAGGLLGYGVGRTVEEDNRRRMEYALEANRPVTWQNPDTGYRYTVVPTQTMYERGRPCREFRMEAEFREGPRDVYGTACRDPDGVWRVVQTD